MLVTLGVVGVAHDTLPCDVFLSWGDNADTTFGVLEGKKRPKFDAM